ncbi:MAG: aminotransferase class V-fold PLP-dependent enzyme [Flavobacteriales bacterium]|nr:aminotransferase class V-fold PLP-dependent enzyme [Flavobacteriales bacterium]
MRDKILDLEKQASALEPNSQQRKVVRDKVVAYTERFIEDIEKNKTYNFLEGQGIGLYDSPISEDGISIEETLELFEENVEKPGLNPASGGHLAYIPGGGIYHSSLGDYIAAITNRYAGVFYPSPGAVRMTNMLLRWMADLIGYPSSSSGSLTSGGSIANLTAIVTARDAKGLKGADYARCVIYTTTQAHHCIDKAINIAGMSEAKRIFIATDDEYRMISNELESQILKDKEDGLIPWLVVAAAGTTDVGAIDPLQKIGEIAQQHDLWFHIDGAYGAFFVLTETGKNLLKGMELSDSIVMDPHKSLFLPYGLGVLLIKDKKHLQHSHRFSANYLQDVVHVEDELSPADISPELTKHFRALRLWLPLKLCGTKAFTACLDEKLLLTKYFREQIMKVPGFEVGGPTQLSVTTFRYVPKSGDANEFNKALLQEILSDGRVFLSSTDLNGIFTLRLAVLAFRSHLRTIDLALEIIVEKTEALASA